MAQGKVRQLFVLAFFLFAIMAQGLFSAWENGQTVDETFYNGYGYPMVRFGNYSFKTEHPPLMTQLGALPLLFIQPNYSLKNPIYVPNTDKGLDNSRMGSRFLYGSWNNPHLILFLERIPSVLVTVFLGGVIYFWALSLFGFPGALLTTSLYSFCPNIIAHGSLYTTDIGVTAFFTFALYRLRVFFEQPTWNHAAWIGFAAALAFLSKASGLFLIPIVTLLFLFYVFEGSHMQSEKIRLNAVLISLSVFLYIVSLSQKIAMMALGPLCLLAFYLAFFHGLGKKISNRYPFLIWVFGFCWFINLGLIFAMMPKRSLTFVLIATAWLLTAFFLILFLNSSKSSAHHKTWARCYCFIWLFSAVFILFDYTNFPETLMKFNPFRGYIESIMASLSHVAGNHRVCVDSSWIKCDWRYFIGSISVKTPLVTLGLFLIGLSVFIFSKIKLRDKLVVVVPFFSFLFVASFLNEINIGLRHILPIYPLLFLISGSVAHGIASSKNLLIKRAATILLITLILLTVQRNIRWLPHHLSYFNEWVGTVEKGATLLSDSNLNWGQDNYRLANHVQKEGIALVKMAGSQFNVPELTYYGVHSEYMSDEDFINPKPGYYVLDISSYVAQNKVSSSYFGGKEPTERIGKTFYLFKVTDPFK